MCYCRFGSDLLLGMELFEEALQKWEQALNIRHHTHSTSSNNSLALQGAACGDFPMVILKLSLIKEHTASSLTLRNTSNIVM